MSLAPDAASSLPILPVSALNRAVREILEGNFSLLRVEGEVSNFSAPSSGHWYFSLKDAHAQVRCAMFRNKNLSVRQRPRDGSLIQVIAQPTLYEGRGDFQLLVENLLDVGQGDLQAQFLAIRNRLDAAGLFAPEHKRPLPQQPRRVAVISSATGAAFHDIRVTLAKRWPLLELTLYPVMVQGDGAAAQIIGALERANRRQSEEVIVIARGGGSAEDLWCFNDEGLARAIFASTLPVITGIGHEIDFTIADCVADLRAATPTAAAEAISPDQQELLQRLSAHKQRLERAVQRRLQDEAQNLDHWRSRLRHPRQTLALAENQWRHLRERLGRAQIQHLAQAESTLSQWHHRVQQQDPRQRWPLLQQRVTEYRERLIRAQAQHTQAAAERLRTGTAQLRLLDPTAILQRGYAIVRNADGHVLTDGHHVRKGELIHTRLARGELRSRVESGAD